MFSVHTADPAGPFSLRNRARGGVAYALKRAVHRSFWAHSLSRVLRKLASFRNHTAHTRLALWLRANRHPFGGNERRVLVYTAFGLTVRRLVELFGSSSLGVATVAIVYICAGTKEEG